MKQLKPTNDFIHKAFEAGLFIKGINGVLQIIGGIILVTIKLVTIEHFFVWLSMLELPHGPNDIFARGIDYLANQLSSDTKLLGALYLLAHGTFKVGLVTSLHFKKSWAYPVAMAFLSVFIAYQIYRLNLHFSIALFILTLIDCTLMALIYREHVAQLEA